LFERFTEKAIKVILLAQEEARRMGHNFVGTEQILLGLIGEGTSGAAKALNKCGLDLKQLREVVLSRIGRGNGFVSVEIPFTPRCKRLLELSWEEARQLGHNFIAPEHLMLGLIRQDEGIAVDVIKELGVDLNALSKDLCGIFFAHEKQVQIQRPKLNHPLLFFERFTPRAMKVVMLAQEESRRMEHNFVGTEQILLGLVSEGTSAAAKSLKNLDLNLRQLRQAIEAKIGRGNGFVAVQIPFTPRCKRLLELAWDEARQLGHNYIGAEHLLLGLIRLRDGVANDVLADFEIDTEVLKLGVIYRIETAIHQEKYSQPRIEHSRSLLSEFQDFCSDAMISVVTIAQEEARAAGSESLEVLHLLLGIIGEGKSETARLLQQEKITAPRLREQFKKSSAPYLNFVEFDTELSRQSRALIDLVWIEAKVSKNKVTPDGLMLAMANGDYQFVTKCLKDVGLDVRKFALALVQAMGNDAIRFSQFEPAVEQRTSKHFFRELADSALKALLFAQGEVRRSNRFEIENVDILLGVVGDGSSLAAQAMEGRGITVNTLRQQIEKLETEEKDRPRVDFLFSQKAVQLLADAWEVSRQRKHRFLSAEHLCIALLADGQLEIKEILQNQGVKV